MKLTLLLLAACGTPAAREPASPHEPAVRVVDGIVSAYVVPIDATHVALIDCGMDPDAKAILDVLVARGLTANSVTDIFITHRHGDHVGGCAPFADARVHALPDGNDDGTEALVDGATVEIGARSVAVFAVPGHTTDSAAFVVDDTLFLGDAAMNENGAVKASPRRFTGAGHEPDTQKQNVPPLVALHARVANLAIRKLVFGHSEPLEGADVLGRLAAVE